MKHIHLSVLMATVLAMPTVLPAQDDGAEPGNITDQLATGLFLNPTAPGRAEGELAAQYCIAVLPVAGAAGVDGVAVGEDTVVGQGGLLIYGLSDQIEVGGQFLLAGPDQSDLSESFGGQVRVQVLDAADSVADVSLGGVLLFNDIERQMVYAAASKKVDCGEDSKCPCNSITFHVGARHFWWSIDGASDIDDTVAYGGIEVPVADSIHLVGEVSTKSDSDAHQPYSVGFQVRNADGFSCSLAAIQPGGTEGAGVFAGIGIPFN